MKYEDVIKICAKHGEQNYKVWPYKNKLMKRCRLCLHEKNKRYQAKIKNDPLRLEENRARHREYWAENKETIKKKRDTPERKEKERLTRRTHFNKYREQYKAKQQHYRDNLSDTYVKRILQGGNKDLKFNDIPEPLVEAKRAVMLLKKGLKAFRRQEVKKENDNLRHRELEINLKKLGSNK